LPFGTRRFPHRRWLGSGALAALVAALLVPLAFTLAPAGPAKAAPVPTARLEVRLDKLNRQADQLVEEYLQHKLALDRTRASLKVLRAQAGQAEKTLHALQAGMAARMAAAYVQGPGTSLASVLGSEDPTQAIDRAQVLDILAERDGSMLDQLEVATRTYETRRNALAAAEKAQAAEVAGLNAKKAEVDRAVAQTRRLIAQNKAAAARPAPRQPGNPIAPPPPPSGGGGGSGAAAVAVRTALAQVGKPYSYGAAGPNAFDCSGLTMYAWGAAGVSLPHSSGAQIGVGRRISFSELQPGDLIFYYSPISHVSMYIGNGQRVSATHTGDYVRVQSLGSGMVGASRPTG
jgi:peptidoglycan DL-endopeptidase CwlO